MTGLAAKISSFAHAHPSLRLLSLQELELPLTCVCVCVWKAVPLETDGIGSRGKEARGEGGEEAPSLPTTHPLP